MISSGLRNYWKTGIQQKLYKSHPIPLWPKRDIKEEGKNIQ
jgi:hypothetical protein